MKFLKQVLAVIVGFFVATGLCMFLFIMVVSVASMGGKSGIKVENNSILVINLDEEIQDFSQKTVIEDFEIENEELNGLNSVLKAIEYAKNDDRISGISIKTASGVQGLAHLKDLREAIKDFKTSKKFVYSFNQGFSLSQKDYYLSSVADSVFVGVQTDILLQGLGSNINYYKDFQEKIGVKMEVFRHGKYKSAVEPYLENAMSEENKEQISVMLQSMWKSFSKEISLSRNISEEKIDEIANHLLGRTPDLALENKLIDAILYADEYEALLCKKTNAKKVKDLKTISILKYVEAVNENISAEKTKKSDKIAIIYADGTIMDGVSYRGIVGDKTIIKALRDAREDKDVKVIVLRVNSPGGSALASELMHREIELTKKEKPIYTSMGNMAASGGYYIACNSNKIFASNETITGSIGVYSSFPNVSELEKKLGISNEQVGTHQFSTGFSRGYNFEEETSPESAKLITEGVEQMYKTFVERVAKGRNKTWDEIHQVAQGRVWTGQDALKLGLVDGILPLNGVLDFVAKEHQLKDYTIETYPTFKISFQDFFKHRLPFSFSAEEVIKKEVGEEFYKKIKKLKEIHTQKGLQARLPYEIEIF